MSREFFSPAEIVAIGSPDLPTTVRSFSRIAEKNGWRTSDCTGRQRSGREGGGGWEYHISVLPESTRLKLQVAFGSPANGNDSPEALRKTNRDALWQAYEQLSKKHKDVCEERLRILNAVNEYRNSFNCTDTVAVEMIAVRNGISPRTIFTYRKMIEGVERADWLAALAPIAKKPKPRAEISEEAWSALLGDYLRPEEPRFTACYRRLERAAEENDWGILPSERSLRRRLNH